MQNNKIFDFEKWWIRIRILINESIFKNFRNPVGLIHPRVSLAFNTLLKEHLSAQFGGIVKFINRVTHKEEDCKDDLKPFKGNITSSTLRLVSLLLLILYSRLWSLIFVNNPVYTENYIKVVFRKYSIRNVIKDIKILILFQNIEQSRPCVALHWNCGMSIVSILSFFIVKFHFAPLIEGYTVIII